MRLKNVLFRLVLLVMCLGVQAKGFAAGQDSLMSKYDQRMMKRMIRWQKLIPDHTKLQFAGSIGLCSMGFGWSYGQSDQWETDIMIGFIPKYHSERTKVTLTLRESYIPWSFAISKSRWYIQPLSCSLFLSSVLDESFWVDEPSRYPKGYYGFSTRIRANISFGQRILYKIPERDRRRSQSIAFYYELGACDTDIVTFVGNRFVKFKDILSLSVGMKVLI